MFEFIESLFGLTALVVIVAALFFGGLGIAELWIERGGEMFLTFFGVLAFSIALPSDAPFILEFIPMAILFVMFWIGMFAGFVLIVGDVRSVGDNLTGKSRLHEHSGVWHDHPHEGMHYHPQGPADSFVCTQKRAH